MEKRLEYIVRRILHSVDIRPFPKNWDMGITDSDGQDVVRFILYPKALPELIDYTYFEVDYSVYKNLLTKDKKVSYK